MGLKMIIRVSARKERTVQAFIIDNRCDNALSSDESDQRNRERSCEVKSIPPPPPPLLVSNTKALQAPKKKKKSQRASYRRLYGVPQAPYRVHLISLN